MRAPNALQNAFSCGDRPDPVFLLDGIALRRRRDYRLTFFCRGVDGSSSKASNASFHEINPSVHQVLSSSCLAILNFLGLSLNPGCFLRSRTASCAFFLVE